MKTITEQMDASQVFCPNLDCQPRGQVGQGNIAIHGRKRPRYRCKTCGKTTSREEGTLFAGLRKPTAPVRAAGLYRWLGGLSRQHQARFSPEGQDDGRTRTSELAGLAGVAHRHGHQTHTQWKNPACLLHMSMLH